MLQKLFTYIGATSCEEVVVNSCFEDLEGRVGLKRAWEFVPNVGKRGMKE